MKDVTADLAKKKLRKPSDKDSALQLQRCYGQIGIPAVAAAARYQGGAKNPAYASVAIESRDRGGSAV
jgi:hypothetical protein